MKQGFLILFLLLSLFGLAQSDFNLKLEASAWKINHNFEDLSNPFSLAYTTGLNFEQVIAKSKFAVLTGVEYTYAPKGNHYVDLSDEQNLLAVIYDQEFNKRFIALVHHRLSVPLLLICYVSDFRLGIGASYSRYIFGEFNQHNTDQQFSDYGLRAQFGARLSKHIMFSVGYYYGLNRFANLSVFPSSEVDIPSISGNMQQISIGIRYSIRNTMSDQKYYLSSFNP